jgi:A/G-specific adenine glycosylase
LTIEYAVSAERATPPVEAVQKRLLAWFTVYGRDLPWRRTRDPYAILVAEMMLQQTGVERVMPKYAAWLERFPTLEDLAAAPRADVIRAWSGLGYNSRAVRLHEIAHQAVDRYAGRLPQRVDELLTLKGIGRYTAGAVACFAHEQDVAFVDTNIRRVLSRVFLGAESDAAPLTEKRLHELAASAIPPGRAWPWHQALMDLGATVCTDARPTCLVCPLQDVCRGAFQSGRAVREAQAAYQARPAPARRKKEGPWRGSTRYYRGRIVAALGALSHGERLSLPALAARIGGETPAGDGPPADAPQHEQTGGGRDADLAWLQTLVTRLAADGLAALHIADDGSVEVSLPE